MTHGEQWYIWKQNINSFRTKFDDAERSPKTIKRMPKEDALAYYSKKCRKAFIGLGFVYQEVNDFEERLELAFIEVRRQTNIMIKREARKNKALYCES